VTTPALRLLHITDTHLFADDGARLRGVDTQRSLNAVLEHASCHPDGPAAILATGDLSQDETAGSYRRFRATLGQRGLPIWCLPGNHDVPGLLDAGLEGAAFRVSGAGLAANWCVVLLNSHSPGDHGGRLGPGRLAELQSILDEHRERHVLVAVHHHALPVGSRWLDELGLRDADDFFALIDRSAQVRGVVSGHVHQASDQLRNGVRFMTTPSTCFQFLPQVAHFALDTQPPGYRWLNLMPDGSIATEIVWIEPPH